VNKYIREAHIMFRYSNIALIHFIISIFVVISSSSSINNSINTAYCFMSTYLELRAGSWRWRRQGGRTPPKRFRRTHFLFRRRSSRHVRIAQPETESTGSHLTHANQARTLDDFIVRFNVWTKVFKRMLSFKLMLRITSDSNQVCNRV